MTITKFKIKQFRNIKVKKIDSELGQKVQASGSKLEKIDDAVVDWQVNQTSQSVQGNSQQMDPQGVPEQKGKTKKVFTQLQLTSQLTYTHWVNLSKKELVSCLKQLSVLTNHVRT